jgi:putative endonuclease
MKTSAQRVGRWGEELAAAYLHQIGYILLEQNACTPYGEIDLVACQTSGDELLNDGGVIVFVEVKTRRSASFGWPEESVTAKKRAHLTAAAQSYLQAHPEISGAWRIDVIAIRVSSPDASPEIVHFENAITAE